MKAWEERDILGIMGAPLFRLPVILFIISLALFFGLEIFLGRRRQAGVDDSGDAGSLKLISRCRDASFLLGILSAFYPVIPLPGGRDLQFITGAGLIFAGFSLRVWAITLLGPWFTTVVAHQENQKLIKTGPYRFLRHPAYTGGLMFYLGFAAAMGSVWGVVAIMALISYALHKRIRVEEKLMVACFGAEYLDYMKRTKKIIPLVY